MQNSACILTAYDAVRREVLCNIVIEFDIPLKLVRLIKMCISETCIRVRVGKHLSDRFPIKKGKNRRCFIFTAFELGFRIGH
jgi:hypothetical protein